MSDLVKRLREDQPVTQDMVSILQCTLQDAAADRIEELEAKLAEMTQMWLEACDVTDLAGVVADAEAKLAKAVAMLEPPAGEDRG